MELMIQFAAPLILLAIASAQDYKTQKISDAILSLLWLSLVVFAPEGLAPAAGAFACLFVLNTLSNYAGRAFFGWADILLLPPFFGFLWALGQPWLALAGPAGMYFGIWDKKEPQPLAPYCLVAFIIGLLIVLFPAVYALLLSY